MRFIIEGARRRWLVDFQREDWVSSGKDDDCEVHELDADTEVAPPMGFRQEAK